MVNCSLCKTMHCSLLQLIFRWQCYGMLHNMHLQQCLPGVLPKLSYCKGQVPINIFPLCKVVQVHAWLFWAMQVFTESIDCQVLCQWLGPCNTPYRKVKDTCLSVMLCMRFHANKCSCKERVLRAPAVSSQSKRNCGAFVILLCHDTQTRSSWLSKVLIVPAMLPWWEHHNTIWFRMQSHLSMRFLSSSCTRGVQARWQASDDGTRYNLS